MKRKVDVIMAVDKCWGLGKYNVIPWNCQQDLSLFKKKTMGNILIMGRKTVENLPKLPNRTIYALSSSKLPICSLNQTIQFQSVVPSIEYALENKKSDQKVFIAGGGQIYDDILDNNRYIIDTLHLSKLKSGYDCDIFLKHRNILREWCMVNHTKYDMFDHYELKYLKYSEHQYLDLLKKLVFQGMKRLGRNGYTKSLFGENMKFDLREGFPLLTTKKMFFRGIVEELLFFIRGQTDSKILEAKKVNIWKGNTSREFLDSIGKPERREGIMGPLYGAQWRHFNGVYNEKTGKTSQGIDQLENIVYDLKFDPYSRRIIMTDFNPCQVKDGVLFPCHSIIIQFFVENGYIDMLAYSRSVDMFHGAPFNIASYALFLTLMAKITNLTPRYLNLSLGDIHIYEEHFEMVNKQLQNIPYVFPTLKLRKDIFSLEDVENLEYKDFILENYKSHSSLKAPMVA